MFKFYCLRAVNSFEFISIAVLIAVVLTSGLFSVKTERDPSIKQQSLVYSHMVTEQKPVHPATRGVK
jgi:hypothetical protein